MLDNHVGFFNKIKGLFVPSISLEDLAMQDGISRDSVEVLDEAVNTNNIYLNYSDKSLIRKEIEKETPKDSSDYSILRLLDNKYQMSKIMKFGDLNYESRLEFWTRLKTIRQEDELGLTLSFFRNSYVISDMKEDFYKEERTITENLFFAKYVPKIIEQEVSKILEEEKSKLSSEDSLDNEIDLSNLEKRLRFVKSKMLDQKTINSIEKRALNDYVKNLIVNDGNPEIIALTKEFLNHFYEENKREEVIKKGIEKILYVSENPIEDVKKFVSEIRILDTNKVHLILNDIKEDYNVQELSKRFLKDSFRYRYSNLN
ncbi:MAG: hypothetical protein PHT94_01825 [Candidatus Nanoarchaeia archaeon]|nr:hypothetical protein [Candidatus Nanoarchaeia archaeon]